MRALVTIGTLVALAGTASAQRIEFAARVGAADVTSLRAEPLGDPNLVALSSFQFEDHTITVTVLDVGRASTRTVSIDRAALTKAFGSGTAAPDGQLVALRGTRNGFYVHESEPFRPNRHWYVEVNARTGAPGKSVSLGTTTADEALSFVGTDGAANAAWFALHRPSVAEVVFERVDLATLAVTTPMRVAWAMKTAHTGYEDHISIHAAPDFARFAVVEYDEVGLGTTPAAQVHFVDAKGSFEVPAMPTTYGVAFSRDGAFAYLGSAELGTVERVDLAAKHVDRTRSGVRLLGHLLLTPAGKLVALATARTYTVYDPDLATRVDVPHVRELAAGAAELHGGGAITSDGRFVVVPATTGNAYLIGRVRD